MNLEEMSLDELKIAAYDLLLQNDQLQLSLRIIHQLIKKKMEATDLIKGGVK